MGRSAFPLVIRLGQTKAKIYETPIRGAPNYTLCWYEGTARKRRVFADLDEAKREGQIQVNALARGEVEMVRLSGVERLEYLRAREALKEFHASLDSAAIEYRDARRLLKGVSLLTAAQHYVATRLVDLPKKTVTEVFHEMLKAKREEGLSDRYLQDLESRLGDFAHSFQCELNSVTGALIRSWLQNKEIANRTRNNFRLAVQTLFSFAKTRRYLAPDWDELSAVPVWKTVSEEVEIFTPGEMTRFLSAAEPRMVPFLAIGGFAGLRTAEIERLDWSDVDLAAGYIKVTAKNSKTGSRRLVPIADNLRVWLRPIAREKGPVLEIANVANAIQRLVLSTAAHSGSGSKSDELAIVPWKHNALRHSFCSYRLATTKNAAQVALEAGNSPKMIFEHYRELVTEADAHRWFAILPT